MMCKSNSEIGLANADVIARVGAANAYIIVRRLDCEVKRPNRFKKTLLER